VIVPSFGSYHGFLDSGLLLIGKLLKQRFHVAKLKSSLDLCHKWPQQCSVCRSESFKFARLLPVLWCLLRFRRKNDVRFGSCFNYYICIYFRILVSNTISCGAGSAKLSGAPLLFSGVHVAWSLVFCIMFYRSLFVLFWFFALPLCCLSFDLRLLITTLVSSNCSHLNMWCSPSKKINNVST